MSWTADLNSGVVVTDEAITGSRHHIASLQQLTKMILLLHTNLDRNTEASADCSDSKTKGENVFAA